MTAEEAIKNLSFAKQVEDMLGEFGGGVKNSDLSRSLAMAIESLRHQPCDDCISREALIERINHEEENFKSDHMESISSGEEDPFVDGVLSGVFVIRQMVKQTPPITPQLKTEHWKRTTDNAGHLVWECKCGWQQRFYTDYCPDCGTKMESEAQDADSN